MRSAAAFAVPGSRWSVSQVEGAAALDEAEWNGLARRGLHLYRWFRAAEDSGWRARHLVVREDRAARAVIPAYLTGPETPKDLHDRWLGPLRGLEHIGLGLRPVLSIQSPFSFTSDALGDTEALPSAVLGQAFDLLDETAARERVKAIVWPFVDPADGAVIAMARERGFAVVDAGTTARLRVSWGSFDDYVASRSKSVRRTIRSDLAALGHAGLEAVSTSDYRAHTDRMDALYRDAYRIRNGRNPRLAAGYFERLASPPSLVISAQLTTSGSRIVGMSLSLAGGSVVDGALAAFEARERGGPAYLNDLVYQPVRRACELGIPWVDLGMGSLYPKVLRGARLRRRVALVRGTGPTMHQVLIALGAAVARRQESKERRMLGPLWGPQCYEDDGERLTASGEGS